MHGLLGGESKQRRHMWPVPLSTTTVAASDASGPDSFCKDGRKICVGDCALFKAPQDSPPFIGIIRSLTVDTQDRLQLSVNWLYRPADVELGEGILLDAAPNEVFYSFHKDEIPTASLLHPCKVSFLRKGVELPSGISSFVCRRVYDTEDKCLWWLTDKDYIKSTCRSQGRQEEVDKLLDKTRLDMHGTVQSGGRSPKPLNGPSSMQQLKSGSDNMQNSSSSFSSQVKGKKRERGDQGPDPIKRERISKTDDDSSKSEISKIADKGGLSDLDGVEKLVQLLQPDSAGKKLDLACRKMLMDVIAVTEQYDCLEHFVQLKGLPVLDEWLQEVHKGKIGDGSSPKENDKSVEEYLFSLLRALDKLPVNLHALQTCNVGKSVNHLRSHKNSEIQRKARSLVDTWKKRVEAEMNMNYEKTSPRRSVSWPTKQVASEVSKAGNRKAVGYSEVSPKISVSHQSASKTSQVKLGSGDSAAKSSLSPSSTKSLTGSVGANVKDPNLRASVAGGNSDLPLTAIKVERSSSSCQSQNNSHSCSSDHAKTVGSCRSTAGSVSVNKLSSGSSRHRKSSNGVHGVAVVQKETTSGKVSASNRKLSSEKASSIGVAHENSPDALHADSGNSQRLIVRLPNTGRSPNRGGAGGCFEDTGGKDMIEKHDNHDRKLKGKSDVLRVCNVSSIKAELCDSKDGLTVSGDGNGAPQPDVRRGAGESGNKVIEVSKTTNSSLGMVPRAGKSREASLSSMNALIESCAKLSEVSASASPPGDDRGMNLLASVATGEMCKSEDVSLSSSPERSSPAPEESCSGTNGKLRQSGDEAAQELCQPNDGANGVTAKEQGNTVDSIQSKDEVRNTTTSTSPTFSRDRHEEKTGECNAQLSSSITNLQQNADDLCSRSDAKPADQTHDASGALSSLHAMQKDNREAEGSNLSKEIIKPGGNWVRSSSISDLKLKGRALMSENNKVDAAEEKLLESSTAVALDVTTSMVKVETKVNGNLPIVSLEKLDEYQNAVEKELSSVIFTDQKQSLLDEVKDVDIHSGSSNVSMDSKADKVAGRKAGGHDLQVERNAMDLGSSSSDQRSECAENSENSIRQFSGAPVSHELSLIPIKEKEPGEKPNGQKLNVPESQAKDEPHTASGNLQVSATGSDTAVRLDFDLNEGFLVDDGNQDEHDTLPVKRGTSSGVHLPSPSAFLASSVSGGFPASVTVAAAAKGSFLPPENPLRIKGELGWKGSAATSAFRPAEPRKSMEMSLHGTDNRLVDPPSKPGRPAFDFDLNVTDERVLEDVASRSSTRVTRSESGSLDRGAGGLDLDLNMVDDSPDLGPFAMSGSGGFDIAYLPTRPSLTGVVSNGGFNISRDFDLNNGPGLDEAVTEAAPRSQHTKTNLPFQAPNPGVRINNAEFGNFSTWCPPGNGYSAITAPPILPGRGEQAYVGPSGSQRILGPAGSTVFTPELYRGPVFSSTPAVAYPSTTPFQYSGFPFETTSFPLSSNSFSGCSTAYMDSSSGGAVCYPTIPSQLVGPAGVVPSPYTRPFVMNLQGGISSVASESRKWGSQGLDLNAGPGTDTERRDERASSVVRQVPLPGPHALTEEQMKMFQMGNVLKRKEPDGGWDPAFSYKQPSWQ